MSPDARLEPRDALVWLGQPEVTSNALSLCDAEQLTTLGQQHRKPNRREDRSGTTLTQAQRRTTIALERSEQAVRHERRSATGAFIGRIAWNRSNDAPSSKAQQSACSPSRWAASRFCSRQAQHG